MSSIWFRPPRSLKAPGLCSGAYVDPRAGKVTFGDYALAWQASHIGRPSTARIVDNALRVHILPALGERPLSTLRHSDIKAFVKALSDSLAPGSVRNVYDVLNRVLNAAVEDRVLVRSPSGRIALPPQLAGEVVPPSTSDVAALTAAIASRYRARVVLLAGSGLRIGEALGLEVSDVDFLRRTVRVERQRLQDGSIGPTKTPKSTRTVPLGQVVVDSLAAHLASYPSQGPLFSTELGTALTYTEWKRVWHEALKLIHRAPKDSALSATNMGVGKPVGRGQPRTFSTHDLRHFTASALISGGASVKQVQTVLGHSSAAITLRVYSHLWPGDEDRTRSVMDAVLSPVADYLRTDAASEAENRRSEWV